MATVIQSFSHDPDWKCLETIISKYPVMKQRSVTSKVIRDAIELYAKYDTVKGTTSLDDFKKNEASPSIDLDKATWRKFCKDEDIDKLKKIESKLIGRLSLVKTAIYERTA